MARDTIKIRGARENNLKDISLEIPRDKLTVFTGLSGSGKSSLAFDTLFAEGNRRFVESLSSYARMFLGQIDKPDVDEIEGLSPAISIDQKTTSKNPRSTVGTVTEIYDYLRLLFARIGVPHCPVCKKEIVAQSIDQIVDRVKTLEIGTRFQILAPVVRGKKGQHEKVFSDAIRDGYARVRVNGEIFDLAEVPSLEKNKKHTIEIVVDRLVLKEDINERLTASLETAFNLAGGIVMLDFVDRDASDPSRTLTLSQNFACEEHDFSMPALAPRMFSFNNPYGACEKCSGLGVHRVLSLSRIIPDTSLSLREGAIMVNGFKTIDDNFTGRLYEAVGEVYGFTLDTPLCEFSEEALHALLHGTGSRKYPVYFTAAGRTRHYQTSFSGILKTMEGRDTRSESDYYDQFKEDHVCEACHGRRLRPEMLAVTVGEKNIAEVCEMPIGDCLRFFETLDLNEKDAFIAREILKEIRARLSFLVQVGLSYLSLSRMSGTLSGGESQRIRLATQIGSSLMGVLYILDEPSIGLHQRDNRKLIGALKNLRDVGNTVVVVEHDEETVREADWVCDIGPRAGVHGGEVIYNGPVEGILDCDASYTGRYLAGKLKIDVPKTRRAGNGKSLTVVGARQNNLKDLTVSFPLGTLTCVTGVSGSGKSSLINGILLPALKRELNRAFDTPGEVDRITGMEELDKVIAIDQSPIGRTPRSNPATYTGVFSDIRALFAQTTDARERGYKQSRFSFNLRGGRCESCQGDGTIKIEMHFLPDVYVTCDVCHGKRYNRETLEVRYHGKSIADVLEMTVDEAVEFFDSIPKIRRKIKTLQDVGLGYIRLGQSSTTLSGGEAQRVKLSCELSRRSTGRTVYLLDEPTTGLHTHDVKKLLSILDRLTEGGNTVIVIEHNLDVIKCADHVIDLGPEGGDGGGTLVACGTPEEVAKHPDSYTGQFLKPLLKLEN
ncbi:MAG: excinuclease ABC subunit UvrA [Clostridia bacterium]|nr:excinuclease ABC subunit UvrA [Clostridia bacterium]